MENHDAPGWTGVRLESVPLESCGAFQDELAVARCRFGCAKTLGDQVDGRGKLALAALEGILHLAVAKLDRRSKPPKILPGQAAFFPWRVRAVSSVSSGRISAVGRRS